MRIEWGNFPDLIVSVPWSDPSPCLSRHKDYAKAKNDGDAPAAVRLLNELVQVQALDDICERFGRVEPMVVAPSVSPGNENNALATGYAAFIARTLQIEHCLTVRQVKTAKRDKSDAWQRLANPCSYTGGVPQQDFILVDDVYTLGGTLADLRSFIESQGGRVIAMSTIAANSGTNAPVAIQPATKRALVRTFGETLDEFWFEEFGYDSSCFTEREARHLLIAGPLDHIRRCVLEAKAS